MFLIGIALVAIVVGGVAKGLVGGDGIEPPTSAMSMSGPDAEGLIEYGIPALETQSVPPQRFIAVLGNASKMAGIRLVPGGYAQGHYCCPSRRAVRIPATIRLARYSPVKHPPTTIAVKSVARVARSTVPTQNNPEATR